METDTTTSQPISCPACGAETSAPASICPSCGYLMDPAGLSPSVKAFIEELDQYDRLIASQEQPPRLGEKIKKNIGCLFWIIFNVATFLIPLAIHLISMPARSAKKPKLTGAENRKASLIRDFRFSNDKKTFLEALLFIRWKTQSLVTEKRNQKTAYWMRLWSQKEDELFQKAEILILEKEIARRTHRRVVKNSRRVKNRAKRKAFMGGLILLADIFLVVAGTLFISGTPFLKGRLFAKNEFKGEISENGDLIFENYRLYIPDYLIEGGSNASYCQFQTAAGDDIVSLGMGYMEVEEYWVTLKNLYRINSYVMEMIGGAFDDCQIFKYEDFQSDYGVQGILYSYRMKKKIKSVEYSGSGKCFMFPCEKDNRWFYVNLMVMGDADRDYEGDFMKILVSVREIK